ncbi:TPM domain-containing protein [Pseudoxanthomonas winnipegensis]|nr:TPM domain-containing protein [Pseudoxanthomonas winnipegensis]
MRPRTRMKPHRLLCTLILVLLLVPLAARALQIPAYTPNVVDPAGLLSEDDTQRINHALAEIRNGQQIWGAVYLAPSLEGESIEQVAATAFEQWRLGKRRGQRPVAGAGDPGAALTLRGRLWSGRHPAGPGRQARAGRCPGSEDATGRYRGRDHRRLRFHGPRGGEGSGHFGAAGAGAGGEARQVEPWSGGLGRIRGPGVAVPAARPLAGQPAARPADGATPGADRGG